MRQGGKKWDELGKEGGYMLIGQYEGSIDEKSRISFPKKLRSVLGDNIIVTYGYENSLIIVSKENWKSLLEGTEGKPFIQSEARETQRFLLGGASFVELDNKGRFLLPAYLREFGKIKEEIIFLGLNNHVELWDKKRWEAYRVNLEKNISTISQKLIAPLNGTAEKGEKSE